MPSCTPRVQRRWHQRPGHLFSAWHSECAWAPPLTCALFTLGPSLSRGYFHPFAPPPSSEWGVALKFTTEWLSLRLVTGRWLSNSDDPKRKLMETLPSSLI